MKPILSYLDFREYLRDFYAERKKKSRFSYREFSKMAGFSSPVFIKLVIEGKANVRKSSIAKLSNAMGLKGEERRYFRNLVLFGQAKNIETKIRYLEVMKSLQGSLTVNELSNEQFEYFSKWYHPIIKELLDIMVFDGDYEKLAGMVNPPITVQEAQESVHLLQKLNLIKKKNGHFIATQKFITTEGLTTGTLAIRNVQKKMANLAAQAIDTMPKESRDISGVSVSISVKSIDKVRDELYKCRRRIFEIASEDTVCDSVYRVNLHLFPISDTVPLKLVKRNKDKAHD